MRCWSTVHIATHGLLSWLLAVSALPSRRDRALVTAAGVVPDIDGAGLLIDFGLGLEAGRSDLYSSWHHVAGHNLLAAILITVTAAILARQRVRTALVAALAFHLHLLCDVAGSGGPDGQSWAVHYFWPLWPERIWEWSGQWPLNGWPNILITVVALVLALRCAWKLGCSPLELFSRRLDAILALALRRRFGEPR